MGNLPYFSKTYDERVLMSSIIGTAVLREKFNNFIVHGAVAPSSSYLVGRMISLVEQTDGLKVLQLGYGKGVFTSELLQKVGENGRIVTFEIDQACEKYAIDDSRITYVFDSAEKISLYFPTTRFDVILSTLPLALMSNEVSQKILKLARAHLASNGTFLQYQYSLYSRKDITSIFSRDPDIFFELRNIPPAFYYRVNNAY